MLFFTWPRTLRNKVLSSRATSDLIVKRTLWWKQNVSLEISVYTIFLTTSLYWWRPMKSCSVGVRFSCMTLFYRGNPLPKSVTQNAKGNIQAFGRKKKWNVQCLGTSFRFDHSFLSNSFEIENILLVLQNRNESPSLQEIISKFKLYASGYTCCERVFKTFTTVSKNLILKIRPIAKYFSFSLRWFYLTRQTTSHNLCIK